MPAPADAGPVAWEYVADDGDDGLPPDVIPLSRTPVTARVSTKPAPGAVPHRLSSKVVVELAGKHGVGFRPNGARNVEKARFGIALSISHALANENFSRDEARDFLADVFASWPVYRRHMALWMRLTPPPERLDLNYALRFLRDLIDIHRRGWRYVAAIGTDPGTGELVIDREAAFGLSRAFRWGPEAADLMEGADPYRKGLTVEPELKPGPRPAAAEWELALTADERAQLQAERRAHHVELEMAAALSGRAISSAWR